MFAASEWHVGCADLDALEHIGRQRRLVRWRGLPLG